MSSERQKGSHPKARARWEGEGEGEGMGVMEGKGGKGRWGRGHDGRARARARVRAWWVGVMGGRGWGHVGKGKGKGTLGRACWEGCDGKARLGREGKGKGMKGGRGRGRGRGREGRVRWEGEGKGKLGRQGWEGRARARREGEGAKGGQGCEGRVRARAHWEGRNGPWEGDSRTGRRQQQSVASQNEGKGKGNDVSHEKSTCRRRGNTRDAPEFEHVADGSSTRRGNSCWPHRPAKKSCFSAFNTFSEKEYITFGRRKTETAVTRPWEWPEAPENCVPTPEVINQICRLRPSIEWLSQSNQRECEWGDSGDEMRLGQFFGQDFFSTVGTSLNWSKFNMPLPPSSTLHAAHAVSILLRCITPPLEWIQWLFLFFFSRYARPGVSAHSVQQWATMNIAAACCTYVWWHALPLFLPLICASKCCEIFMVCSFICCATRCTDLSFIHACALIFATYTRLPPLPFVLTRPVVASPSPHLCLCLAFTLPPPRLHLASLSLCLCLPQPSLDLWHIGMPLGHADKGGGWRMCSWDGKVGACEDVKGSVAEQESTGGARGSARECARGYARECAKGCARECEGAQWAWGSMRECEEAWGNARECRGAQAECMPVHWLAVVSIIR